MSSLVCASLAASQVISLTSPVSTQATLCALGWFGLASDRVLSRPATAWLSAAVRLFFDWTLSMRFALCFVLAVCPFAFLQLVLPTVPALAASAIVALRVTLCFALLFLC